MLKYLIEIKNRLFLLFLTYISVIISAYFYKEILLFSVVQPKYTLIDNKISLSYFIFTDVTEIFSVYMQLILFVSLQFLLVFAIYHVFIFFIPALFKLEYAYTQFLIKIILTAWVFSAFIANNYLIPLSWNFFLGFQNIIVDKSFNIYFEAKLSEYFNFYISFYYVSCFYLQFSIAVFFALHYINTELGNMRRFRKLYYFSFVMLATFLCPDFITQLLLSIILIMVYEFLSVVFLVKFFKKPFREYCDQI